MFILLGSHQVSLLGWIVIFVSNYFLNLIIVGFLCDYTDIIYTNENVIYWLMEKRTHESRIKGGSYLTFEFIFLDENQEEVSLFGNQEVYFFMVENEKYSLVKRMNRIISYKVQED